MNDSKTLLKHGTFLLIVGNVGNLSNYFYHFFMSRQLSVIDYGTLMALIALMNILGVGAGAIQLVTAQKISASIAQNRYHQTRQLYWFILKWMFITGIFVSLIYILSVPLLARYLRIQEHYLFYIIALALALSFITPVVTGALLGLQKFTGFGINGIISALSRLLIGITLVLSGFGLVGALFAFPGLLIVSILIGFYLLKNFLLSDDLNSNKNTEDITFKSTLGHILPTIFALWLFSILCQIDAIIVKRYFSEHDAGLYAAAALIGKAFLFIPAAFTQVMLPKVSGEYAAQRDTKHLLDKTIFYGFILCLIGIIVCLLFPEWILWLATGNKYLEIAPLLRLFPIAITPLALSHIFVNYHLARLKSKFIFSFLVMALIHTGLLILFNDTFYQILLVIFFSGTIIFLWNYYIVRKETPRR